MTPLPSKKRSELRAEAHKLSPVVIIGDKGLTEEVVAEVDRSLKAHELIKVRAATDEREARGQWMQTLCERLQAHPVQQIGKVFVIYRENPKAKVEKPKRKLGPGPLPRSGEVRKPRFGKTSLDPRKARTTERTEERGATGTSHPRSRTPSPRPASAPPRRRPRTSR